MRKTLSYAVCLMCMAVTTAAVSQDRPSPEFALAKAMPKDPILVWLKKTDSIPAVYDAVREIYQSWLTPSERRRLESSFGVGADGFSMREKLLDQLGPEVGLVLPDLSIEELVDRYPRAVAFLMNRGIVCMNCGEPVWWTLGEAIRKRGLDIDRTLVDLRRFIGEEP